MSLCGFVNDVCTGLFSINTFMVCNMVLLLYAFYILECLCVRVYRIVAYSRRVFDVFFVMFSIFGSNVNWLALHTQITCPAANRVL